jgi:cyclophilin family peptidyl-prolyl cis-trans isomerase
MDRHVKRPAVFCMAWFALVGVVATTSLANPVQTAPAAKAPATPAAVTAASEKSPAAAGSTGPKAAQFEAMFAEWKDLLKKLRALRDEHQSTASEKQPAVETQYNKLVAQGEALLPKLAAAAEAAYLEAPNADPQLAGFMVGLVVENCGNEMFRRSIDNYEEAYRLGRLLLEKKCVNPLLPALSGIAAFCVNDFDRAETWLAQAKEKGVLEKLGRESGAMASGCIEQIPFYRSAWKKEQEIRAAEAKADDLPRVLLKTSKGDIELELFENEAPNTVANFIALVQKKFYNGAPFHRVLPRFMAQGGDPTGTGTGGPGYEIDCECRKPDYRLHFRGSLSMANTGVPNTGGSQFFLTFVPTRLLDGKHTVFGRITKGLDALAKIQHRNPEEPSAAEITPDKIVEATVLRKRNHPYEPKTHPSSRPPR